MSDRIWDPDLKLEPFEGFSTIDHCPKCGSYKVMGKQFTLPSRTERQKADYGDTFTVIDRYCRDCRHLESWVRGTEGYGEFVDRWQTVDPAKRRRNDELARRNAARREIQERRWAARDRFPRRKDYGREWRREELEIDDCPSFIWYLDKCVRHREGYEDHREEGEALIARAEEVLRTRAMLGLATGDRGAVPETFAFHRKGLELYYGRLLFQPLIAAHPDDDRPRRALGEVYIEHGVSFPTNSFKMALDIPRRLREDHRFDLHSLGALPDLPPFYGAPRYAWVRHADYCDLRVPLDNGDNKGIIGSHVLPLDSVPRHNFFGGFREACSIAAQDLIDYGEELYATAPIRHVALSYCHEVDPRVLAESVHLRRLRSLVFIGGRHGRADDRWFKTFFESPNLENIRYLHFHQSPITDITWQTLAAATAAGRLPLLSWADSVSNLLTDENKRDSLERRFGFLPWLHGRAFYGEDSPDLERVSEHPLATSRHRAAFEAARRAELAARVGPVWPNLEPRTVPPRITGDRARLRRGIRDGDPAAPFAAELAAAATLDRRASRAQLLAWLETSAPALAAHVAAELEAFERSVADPRVAFEPRVLPSMMRDQPWLRHPLALEKKGYIADLQFFCAVPVAATLPARALLSMPVTALPPLAHLTLTYADDPGLFEELLAADRLRAVRTLALPERVDGVPVNFLTGNHIEALSNTEGLVNLSTLDVSGHGFDPEITEWMLTREAKARFPRLAQVHGLPFVPEHYIPDVPWRDPIKTFGTRTVHPWVVAAITATGRHRSGSQQ